MALPENKGEVIRGYELESKFFIKHFLTNLKISSIIVFFCALILASLALILRTKSNLYSFQIVAPITKGATADTEDGLVKGFQELVDDPDFQVLFFQKLDPSMLKDKIAGLNGVINNEFREYLKAFRPIDPRSKDSVQMKRKSPLITILPGPTEGSLYIVLRLPLLIGETVLDQPFVETANLKISERNALKARANVENFKNRLNEESDMMSVLIAERANKFDENQKELTDLFFDLESLSYELSRLLSEAKLLAEVNRASKAIDPSNENISFNMPNTDVSFDLRIRWLIRAINVLSSSKQLQGQQLDLFKSRISQLQSKMAQYRSFTRVSTAWENSLIKRFDETIKNKLPTNSEIMLPSVAVKSKTVASPANSTDISSEYNLSWKLFCIYGFVLGVLIAISRVFFIRAIHYPV